jgi:hypothetical protein
MRLGHYPGRTEEGSTPDLALLCEAADGIRTHDLLHGKWSPSYCQLQPWAASYLDPGTVCIATGAACCLLLPSDPSIPFR